MRSNLYSIFLHVALIALAATTLGLTKQKRDLLAALSPAAPQIEVGTSVGAFDVQHLDGDASTLDWNTDRSRLLFVFTTTCPACKQNQEAWRALSEATDDRVDILGVSLDTLEATSAYRSEHELPFEVVVAADREAFAGAYQVSAVPTTLLVSSDGRVQGVWTGALSTEQQADVAAGTHQDPHA